jgi:hypothetical protein
MISAGLPEFMAAQIVLLFGLLRQGLTEAVTDTVRAWTGRPPRSFAEFAHDHAGIFGANAPLTR